MICALFKDESDEGVGPGPLPRACSITASTTMCAGSADAAGQGAAVQAQIENHAATDESTGCGVRGATERGTYATIDRTTAEGILDGTDTIEAVPS